MASELRRNLLVATAMQVLLDAGVPVPVGDVVAGVAKRVELNDHELSRNASGGERYDTFLRFASGWLVGAGWLQKSRAGWQLTPAGEEAFRQLSSAEFLRTCSRRYRVDLQARRSGELEADPRWVTLREAVEAIPEGSWTAYKDLAELIGMPAQSIGTYLANNPVANGYRVLSVNGTISPDFRWSDPTVRDDPQRILEAEGVRFENGRAAESQRVTSDDLREFMNSAVAGARAWLVRGSAVAGINVVGRWLADGFVSVAASHLRPVEAGTALDELRQAVEVDYAHLSYNQRTAKLAELHAFLNRMSIGDALVTTSEGRVYVGRVTGDAVFGEGNDSQTTIRRQAGWRAEGVDFGELPEQLQARLKSSATIVDLTELSAQVESLLGSSEEPATQRSAEAALPDLSPAVVQRLLVGAEWLAEFVDLLRTRRQVILYGPPGTGKTFLALHVAEALTDAANVQLVQFHPAYSYEDFFEGYRPAGIDEAGRLGFTLRPGPLRTIVDRAAEDPGTPYILIIDEINRANLAKVFGELYFLLEYRDRQIDLMYGSGDAGRDFSLPKNLYIVGTMNTADRSIALVDAAMRRRFAFLSLHPNDEHLRGVLRAWLDREGLPTEPADVLDVLNSRIPDRDFAIGPSYLMRREAGTEAGLDRIWRTSILPLLEELHYGDEVDVARRYGLPALRAAAAARRGEAAGEPTA